MILSLVERDEIGDDCALHRAQGRDPLFDLPDAPRGRFAAGIHVDIDPKGAGGDRNGHGVRDHNLQGDGDAGPDGLQGWCDDAGDDQIRRGVRDLDGRGIGNPCGLHTTRGCVYRPCVRFNLILPDRVHRNFEIHIDIPGIGGHIQ